MSGGTVDKPVHIWEGHYLNAIIQCVPGLPGVDHGKPLQAKVPHGDPH